MNKLFKKLDALGFTRSAVVIGCTLLVFNATASGDDFNNMHKQLNIMNNIIKSSVNVPNNRNESRITGVESLYLYGQGAVFTINSRSSSDRWGNYSFNFSALPIAPVAPVSRMPPESEFEREMESRIESEMSSASEAISGYERVIDIVEGDREVYRELRDEQRDLAHEVRDLEREAKDLEYQLKRANEKAKQEITAEIHALEKRKNTFEKNRQAIDVKVAEIKAEQQKQAVNQEKERHNYYKTLTKSLTQTLCLYGNGLKALPIDEHVTIILKAAGAKESSRYKDDIYVFDKKDIVACSSEKINEDQLLSKAKGYQY